MRSPVRTRTVRRRPALWGLLAALVVVAATLGSGPVASAGQDDPSPAVGQRQARTVDVMTRNLYLGADLGPVLTALASGNPAAVVGAATQTWAAVQATRPAERLGAVADEIVAADPDVVGLQEVTTWTTWAYDPSTGTASSPTVAYDFLALLLDALADRGADYREVAGATADNFASPPIPVLAGAAFPTAAVSLADRDVILARHDVTTRNARNGTFDTIVSFPLGASTLPVPRGWGSVDVRAGRARLRFVNSHLEAFGVPGVDAEQVRVAQVGELLAAQEEVAAKEGELPMVYVGDYNSRAPSAPAYTRLLAGVGQDAWTRNRPHRDGDTCCFEPTLRALDDELTSRIDLVLHSRGVKAPRTYLVGESDADLTPSGLRPSDHAGVVARLVVPAARP